MTQPTFNFDIKSTIDLSGLKEFEELVRARYATRVGVIGDKQRRNKDDNTNAQILLEHEMGVISRHLPRRSVFDSLRINQQALVLDMQKIMRGYLAGYVKSVKDVYKLFGLAALIYCQRAFDTSGYGRWPSLKHNTILSYLEQKKSYMKTAGLAMNIATQTYTAPSRLTFSGQLRQAMKSDVIEE